MSNIDMFKIKYYKKHISTLLITALLLSAVIFKKEIIEFYNNIPIHFAIVKIAIAIKQKENNQIYNLINVEKLIKNLSDNLYDQSLIAQNHTPADREKYRNLISNQVLSITKNYLSTWKKPNMNLLDPQYKLLSALFEEYNQRLFIDLKIDSNNFRINHISEDTATIIFPLHHLRYGTSTIKILLVKNNGDWMIQEILDVSTAIARFDLARKRNLWFKENQNFWTRKSKPYFTNK